MKCKDCGTTLIPYAEFLYYCNKCKKIVDKEDELMGFEWN